MTRHRAFQGSLYDLAVGRLDEELRIELERHLDGCAECRADLETLRQVVSSLPSPADNPAGELTDAQWQAFADRVTEEIRQTVPRRAGILGEMAEEVTGLLSRSWKPVWGTAGALAVLVAAFLLMQEKPIPAEVAPAPQASSPSLQAAAPSPAPADSTSLRVARYLQRSGTLLVGLANRKSRDEIDDLSAEQEISRGLVRESRALRKEPLDAQSDALLGDLEKLMSELADRESAIDREHLARIRDGIDSRNLLFKVRMTEELMTRRAQMQVASHGR